MIFDLINPSDPYTLETHDYEVACVSVVLLGEGKYSIKQVDGDFEMPIFMFGGHDEWFHKTFGKTMEKTIQKVIQEKKTELIDCLQSVIVGSPKDRTLYLEALSLIDGEAQKQQWRDKWHDVHRGSMNNIGSRALKLASFVLDNY